MFAVEDEGVEHGEEGRVPDSDQILALELEVCGELVGYLVNTVQEHQEDGVQVTRLVDLRGLRQSVIPRELEAQVDPDSLDQHLQALPGPEDLTEDDHGQGGDEEGRGATFSLHQDDSFPLQDRLGHRAGRVESHGQTGQPAGGLQAGEVSFLLLLHLLLTVGTVKLQQGSKALLQVRRFREESVNINVFSLKFPGKIKC